MLKDFEDQLHLGQLLSLQKDEVVTIERIFKKTLPQLLWSKSKLLVCLENPQPV